MVEFDQMWFIFQYSLPCGPHTSSIGVAVLGFLWYRSSHPDPSTADMTSSLARFCFPAKSCCFFMLGEREQSDGAKSGEYGGWSTSSKSQSRTAAIASLQPQTCVQEHCPAETGLPSSVFQAILKCLYTVLCTTFEILLYIHCGFVVWKETMQLVSEKVESNACQVVLLMRHTFLIVSLWTFQPNLVSCLSLHVHVPSYKFSLSGSHSLRNVENIKFKKVIYFSAIIILQPFSFPFFLNKS